MEWRTPQKGLLCLRTSRLPSCGCRTGRPASAAVPCCNAENAAVATPDAAASCLPGATSCWAECVLLPALEGVASPQAGAAAQAASSGRYRASKAAGCCRGPPRPDAPTAHPVAASRSHFRTHACMCHTCLFSGETGVRKRDQNCRARLTVHRLRTRMQLRVSAVLQRTCSADVAHLRTVCCRV
jgi:hypothetical protein